MRWSAWPAPAKINRFLHITGRRDDGYHLLQTLFQFVSLEDTVRLRLRADGEVRRQAGADGVAAEEDLAVRAARALYEAAGPNLPGVDIEVVKRIPAGGGLGGGSSDAATVLLALDHLLGLHLPLDVLAEIGQRLGADVPVFVRGRAAWAEGIGEQLTPVDVDEPPLILVTPDEHVDTGRIFGSPRLTRDSDFLTISRLFAGEQGIARSLTLLTRNDCTAVTEAEYPGVAEAGRLLHTRFGNARMTGTGATVFATLGEGHAAEADAREWAAGLPVRWRASVVASLNRSPMHVALEASRCEACRARTAD